MPSRLLVKVFPNYGDGDYGPDYALIQHAPQTGTIDLREAITTTVEFAVRFGHHSGNGGALLSTEWFLNDVPLKVQWLRFSALYDEDGGDPPFIDDLNFEDQVVLPEDWQPTLGKEYEPGRFDNEFTAVDLQTLRIFVEGDLEVEATVYGTGKRFCSLQFESLALFD